MAELNNMFSYTGTFNGVTIVSSRTYGKHMRRARGTVTPVELNDAFTVSRDRTPKANAYAKLVKDGFDPYRYRFHDGTLWHRLVSFFRLQLRKDSIKWDGLVDFEFCTRYPFDRVFAEKASFTITDEEEKKFSIVASSQYRLDPLKEHRANQYQQTLIVLFLDSKGDPTVFTESTIFRLNSTVPQEQTVSFPIPPDAKVALVAMQCDLWTDGELLEIMARKGMKMVIATGLTPATAATSPEVPKVYL